MNYLPCDQLASDIIDAQNEIEEETGVPISLDFKTVEAMIEDVERMYASGAFENFEEILEAALGAHEMHHEIEYTAYKRLLGTFFGRRARWRQEQNRENDKEASFAPC